jgi:hypothetical protein
MKQESEKEAAIVFIVAMLFVSAFIFMYIKSGSFGIQKAENMGPSKWEITIQQKGDNKYLKARINHGDESLFKLMNGGKVYLTKDQIESLSDYDKDREEVTLTIGYSTFSGVSYEESNESGLGKDLIENLGSYVAIESNNIIVEK